MGLWEKQEGTINETFVLLQQTHTANESPICRWFYFKSGHQETLSPWNKMISFNGTNLKIFKLDEDVFPCQRRVSLGSEDVLISSSK